MQNYKPKYQEKRSNRDKRSSSKQFPVEQALANALQQIAPALKQFLNDIDESEQRIADAEIRQTTAELRTMQAIKGNIEIERAESHSSHTVKKPKKSPKVLSDQKKKVLKIIAEMRSNGKTFEQITSYLIEKNIPTLSGRGKWHAQTIHRICIDNLDNNGNGQIIKQEPQ